MNTINLLLARNENFKFIGVNFTSFYDDHTKALKTGKTYYYKTTEDFEIGDNAVVSVNDELKIVRVVVLDCILNLDTNINYKWVVSKVDKDEFNRCIEVEKELTYQINTLRLKALRKGLEDEFKAEFGAKAIKTLVRL